jgi:hypothetical protein
MPASVQIDFPKSDAEKMIRAMERARNSLGISAGEGVRLASQYLVRSVAASTAVAPKHRDVEMVVVEKPRVLKSGRVSSRPERRKVWGSYRYIQGVKLWKPLVNPFPKNKTEAKAHRGAQINMRGLAKAAWWWAAQGVGGASGASTGATNAARAKARQYGHHEGNLSGMQPYAIMANRLPYAASALANGPRDVTVAMSKAASQLNLYVSRKLKEATQ